MASKQLTSKQMSFKQIISVECFSDEYCSKFTSFSDKNVSTNNFWSNSNQTFGQNTFQKTTFGQTIFVPVPFGQIVFEEDFGYSYKIVLNQRLSYFRTKSFWINDSYIFEQNRFEQTRQLKHIISCPHSHNFLRSKMENKKREKN